MKLYFETKPNASGNKLQLIIDTETGKPQKGYYLFHFSVDAVKLDRKQLEKLFEIVFAEWIKKDGAEV
jgi:hypothetical protein